MWFNSRVTKLAIICWQYERQKLRLTDVFDSLRPSTLPPWGLEILPISQACRLRGGWISAEESEPLTARSPFGVPPSAASWPR
jgi:hypothetical protein